MEALGSVYPQIMENSLITATGDGTIDIDLRKYFMTPGSRELMATFIARSPATLCLATGLVTKFEQCSVSTSASYADVTGATFLTTGVLAKSGVSTLQTIWFGINPLKPFLRCYHTVTGNGAVVFVQLFMVKRQA